MLRRGETLPEPVIRTIEKKTVASEGWRELFTDIYRKRTFTIWALWEYGYMINNGLVTWLPTLYKSVFGLPIQTALAYGWTTSAFGVLASIVYAL